MSDGIKVELVGAEDVDVRLRMLPDTIRARLRTVVSEESIKLRDNVKDVIVDLFHGSRGPLYQSIGAEMEESADTISGTVFSRGVVYARIQEFGGIIKHPGSSKFQAFMGREGKMVFTHFTRPHPIPIPERSYMRSTLALRRLEIIGAIKSAVTDAI